MKKHVVLSVFLFSIFSVIFTIGCNNALIKPNSGEVSVAIKTTEGAIGRNSTETQAWNVKAWIEYKDGSTSHNQEHSSVSDEKTKLTFNELEIGKELRIHVELTTTDDTPRKFSGTSDWVTIDAGPNVVIIFVTEDKTETEEPETEEPETEEPETIINAEVPVISSSPQSIVKAFSSGALEAVEGELSVTATVSAGNLSYQWYSSTNAINSDGQPIAGATESTYIAKVEAGQTSFFYCIIKNTNNNVNGTKTATATSNVATVASLVGTLSEIKAEYTGKYELLGKEINLNNVSITETYTVDGGEPTSVTVTASSVSNEFTVAYDDTSEEGVIGYVPTVVTNKNNEDISTELTIPVKYELNSDLLSIRGNTPVAQYAELTLQALYQVQNEGEDVSYKLYDKAGSSDTHEVNGLINVLWEGATAGSNSWQATVDTTSAEEKTVTVKLSSSDEWCVTTETVTKSETITITPWTLSLSGGTSEDNLAGGTTYTLSVTNPSNSSTTQSITYGVSGTGFSIKDNILTTPATTTTDQSATITAMSGEHTLDTLTVKVLAEEPLGSQTNPVTTWDELDSAINGSSKEIYVNASTIQATSVINVESEKQIIPQQNITIERTGSFNENFFNIANNGNLTLGNGTHKITLDGKSISSVKPLVNTSGTLVLNNCTLQNNINTNTVTSPSTLFIYSGTTTLNNVSFTGNEGSFDSTSAKDIYLYQNLSSAPILTIGENFNATEIYFNAALTTVSYPQIRLTENTSVSDTAKPVITIGSTTPTNIPVITKNTYTGEINSLFSVIDTNKTQYTLDENGTVVTNN